MSWNFNPFMAEFAEFVLENMKIYLHIPHHSAMLQHHRSLKLTLKEDENIHIAQSQYHGCLWLGGGKSQGISSYDIDLICSESSSLHTRRSQGMSRHGIDPVCLKYSGLSTRKDEE